MHALQYIKKCKTYLTKDRFKILELDAKSLNHYHTALEYFTAVLPLILEAQKSHGPYNGLAASRLFHSHVRWKLRYRIPLLGGFF